MAKIFYLGGGTHARGMLRAVVTVQQLESLIPPEFVTRVGLDFPQGSDTPITLVKISSDEGTAIWPVGYCSVEATPTDFDDRLRFLQEPITSPQGQTTQARRNGSALIRWLTQGMRSGG